MTLPTRYTVGHRVYQPGAVDAHGNPVESWADETTVDVYAIAPRVSSEPTPGRAEIVEGITVFAPPEVTADHRDRWVISGVEYEVDGEVGDWGRGPFGWAPGVQLNLSRVEG